MKQSRFMLRGYSHVDDFLTIIFTAAFEQALR